MRTITPAQLVVLLAKVKGAKPLTISALVDARCRKTGNPFIEVKKLSKVNGFTGASFESSVNRQIQREQGKETESTFQAGERKWGDRVSPALVENKGKWYLAIQPRATAKPIYLTRKEAGAPLMVTPKEAIEAFLPAVKSQAEAQGVEHEVIYRNYSIDGIAAITMDGETYRIRHEAKPASA